MPAFRNTNNPASLQITTHIGCRNLCSYCPQQSIVDACKERAVTHMMSFGTFTACLNHLPRKVQLVFSGFSEPWFNPECSRMLWYASQQDYTLGAETTLSSMTVQDIEQLKHIHFTRFVVHLPDNQQRTRIEVNETYIETVQRLLDKPLRNLIWKVHRIAAGDTLHADLAPMFEKSGVPIHFTGTSHRAGRINSERETLLPNAGKNLLPCAEFRNNVLLPNGDVALCSMDWSLQHTLGNLLAQRYESLFEGETFQSIQKSLRDASLPLLCRACDKDIVRRNRLQQAQKNWKEKRKQRGNPLDF